MRTLHMDSEPRTKHPSTSRHATTPACSWPRGMDRREAASRVKLPLDISGSQAVRAVQRQNFLVLRQRGSHVRSAKDALTESGPGGKRDESGARTRTHSKARFACEIQRRPYHQKACAKRWRFHWVLRAALSSARASPHRFPHAPHQQDPRPILWPQAKRPPRRSLVVLKPRSPPSRSPIADSGAAHLVRRGTNDRPSRPKSRVG